MTAQPLMSSPVVDVAALGKEPEAAVVDPAAFVETAADGSQSLELAVRGARCGGCLRKIEHGVGQLPGVRAARLNLTTGQLHVAWTGAALRPLDISERLASLGYRAVPFVADQERDAQREEERWLLRCLAVAGFAAANVMLLSVSQWGGAGEMGPATRALMQWISAGLALPAVAYAGMPFFRSAFAALGVGQANMDVPISLAVLLASLLSVAVMARGESGTYFEAPVTLLFFLLIGRVLDVRLRGRARSAGAQLAALQTQTASRVEADGQVIAVASRELRPGDAILVGAGERIPVNGVVEQGTSLVNTSLVTGESVPDAIAPGGTVYSGFLNLGQPLQVRVTAAEGQSLLAEIARMIEDGARSRAGYVRVADKAASLYVPVVHSLAALTFIGWAVFGGAGLETAFVNAIAVLIITCPCALGLAVPVVQIVATGRLFERGVLVKGGEALERLAEAGYAVLDKTGTLTDPVLSMDTTDADASALQMAASLARASRHPLAMALARSVGAGPVAAEISEETGAGIRGVVGGRTVRLGSRAWCGLDGGEARQGPELWLSVEGQAPICFRFAERVKPGAAGLVEGLRARGIAAELLSGDRQAAVDRVAREVGLTQARAAQGPGDKARRLAVLKREGRQVLMVGDGLNDAPSLSGAHVSISPAGAADVSRTAADIVLSNASLLPILDALDVARAARRRGLENLGFAVAYNAIAIPIAMGGQASPLIAAVAMSASSLLVTTNALRLSAMRLQSRATEEVLP